MFSGAGLSALYSSIFPERVDRLVLMDLINIGPSPVTKQVRKTRNAIKASDRYVMAGSDLDYVAILVLKAVALCYKKHRHSHKIREPNRT